LVVGEATANFRRQHEELQALGLELFCKLDPASIDAAEMRRTLSRFAGKLLVHARMENDALYPRLLHHEDPRVAAQGRALYEDVKGIYLAFETFMQKWTPTGAIEAEPVAFARECRKVLKLLAMRMMRENDELYPLADASG
jgi:hypothetical protein